MATLKCKMCGGDLVIDPDSTVCECEYCGSKQTIPVVDDEKKIKLYERANKLRYNCDFDKAAGVYENIIADFPDEAEAYWGLLLCKFGIEYVDSPDNRKVPTCHRSSFDSIMDDPDFEMVMENSDSAARAVYRAEAKQIEEIRKGIIEVSGKEPPYDIFICYKETAEDGQRTLDSVLAQDIYDALTDKGYRVFFSRVSLEDKLGTEYEPYIFAALNSAKLMLAFGTSYDYYNAVWVKNEWSRYLKLMAQDKSKHLIPCYKDIDAYDMPKEFAKLQAQDLGKVGATQDLLRGIEKILGGKQEQTSVQQAQTVIVQQNGGGPNVAALLKRGYDSLEDGVFDEAKTFFNDALNSNAESAEAYLGLFMAEIKAANRTKAQSKYVAGNYTDNRYWKRAKQYASGELADTLNEWDYLRDIRLQREADAARKAKEEAERKAHEAKEEAERKAHEAEEARKKIPEVVKLLQEQLSAGKFELTEEETAEQARLTAAAESAETAVQSAEKAYAGSAEGQEVSRLEGLIASKKTQLAGLGIFKGKERKTLQAQIDTLENTLSEAKKKVFEKLTEIDDLKKQAADAKKLAEAYGVQIRTKKKEVLQKKINELMLKGAADVGDTVEFGKYEQGSGVEPIKWRVLARSDKRVLLISEYALECRKYHGTSTDITWEKCDLRKWLNHDFMNTAFTEAEQSLIAETRCPADKNPKYNTPAGNATTDKVFLLSILETEKYFKSDQDRKAAPTAYAKKQGAFVSKAFKTAGEACCWWWLRSPGDGSRRAASVSLDGSLLGYGDSVCSEDGCVRPAFWLNLDS